MSLPSNDELVKYLLTTGALSTPRITKAFLMVDRAEFVTASLQAQAYDDNPLPIGLGQTISQPSTVAFMLELLQPRLNDKILEVGAGSGYVAALLSKIVGKSGLVVAMERHRELTRQIKDNIARYNFKQLKILTADGSKGNQQYAPYDKIIISAAAAEMPKEIMEQLAPKGRMVVPVGRELQSMTLIERQGDKLVQRSFPGFIFVPLVN